TGNFTLLNNQSGNVTVYNMLMDTQRVTPGTSFKVINSLVGLETGKIVDSKTPISIGNTSLTLIDAFKNSSTPFFQEVARLVGKDTLQRSIDSLQYGNKNLSGAIDSFWLNNNLKISPDEQLGLMYRLYFDKLPFSKYAQQNVRTLMKQEDNTLYKYYYVTGSGTDEKNNTIGWVLGWVEENIHVYFFSTLVKSQDKNTNIDSVSLKITRGILSELGYFKGNK
ncbi:MAG: penicillin-binding transpeptidase domain-containing protein, partial [Ginsengibacter sp.]